VTSLEVAAKNGSWKDALDTSEQEIRRAMQFGFTPAELKMETTELLGSVKTSALQADTRPNAALAGQQRPAQHQEDRF
jgi:zinc protease